MASNPPIVAQFEAVLESEHPWTCKDIGSNSISSMLHESNPTGAAAFLTGAKIINRMDNIPLIPPVAIRRVLNREFDAYLASISDVIDKYQLHKALGLTAMEGIPVLEEDVQSSTLTSQQQPSDSSLFKELERLVPTIKVSKNMDRLDRTRMLSSTNPSTWKSIPPVFNDSKFDLKNPDTFGQVVGFKDVVGFSSGQQQEETTYRLLTDQLTLYQDTIEVQLLQEISRRSSSFFGALENLQQLEKETEECVSKIEALRHSLNVIRETNIKRGLHVIRLKQTRSDLALLYGAVKLISQAKQSQPVIKMLLNQCDYVGALDVLDECSAFLVGHSSPDDDDQVVIETISADITVKKNQPTIPKNIDLRGVGSISHISSQLAEISNTIATTMENELGSILLKDLQIQLDMIANTPFSQQGFSVTGDRQKTFIGIGTSSIRSILSETYNFSFTTPAASTPLNVPLKLEMPPLTSQDEALKATLTPLIYGLIRVDKLEKALSSYKESLLKQLKLMSKQYYPKISEPATSLGKAELKKHEQEELSKQLKALTFDSFYSTLVKIIIFFLRSLQRAAIVNEIIITIMNEAEKNGIKIGINKFSVVEGAGSEKSPKVDDEQDVFDSIAHIHLPDEEEKRPHPEVDTSHSSLNAPSTYNQFLINVRNVLFNAIDLTHTRCAKLIAVRQEQNSQLNPKDFYRLFNATWEFLLAGELLCGRMCFGLKGSILAQAKSFVNYFHEEKSKQIALLLDNEQWMQADIPIDFQRISEQLQSEYKDTSKVQPIAAKVSRERSHPLDGEGGDDEGDVTNAARRYNSSSESLNDPIEENKVSSKYMVIDGNQYYAVVTALMFMKSLTDYVQCAKNVPSLAPEILNRVFEFLKLFNSRTCQLILGSGAIRSAGLDSITAKHISLASQSLGLVMALIPYIRTGMSQHLSARQHVLLADFDRIIGDYRNHQNELYMHLVNIMVDRLQSHASNLIAINWDTPDQKDFGSDGISVTMCTLVRETTSLHKVIAKYLPPESLRSIMSQIFRSYVKRLDDDLKKVDLFSSAGKNRLLTDAHYFTENLSKLDGIDGPGSQIEVCVNNIKIKDKRTYQPPLTRPPTTGPPKPPPAPPKSNPFGRVVW